ncbi:unnamed protein product [Larinioides sclopetarius]|uniref:Uncharacterized protein n=1 Tax=Larinioides sclopetarius TaxID=280406 RepID=A0AAV1ZCT1_9ARAC
MKISVKSIYRLFSSKGMEMVGRSKFSFSQNYFTTETRKKIQISCLCLRRKTNLYTSSIHGYFWPALRLTVETSEI